MPHVGPHGLETTSNLAAELFLAYLVEFQLFLPSTFEHLHYGPTWTWSGHANGHHARCDYLAIPLTWFVTEISSTCVHSLDLGGKTIDHIPVTIDVKLTYQRDTALPTKPSFDRRRFQSTPIDTLKEIFDSPPEVPWDSSIDEHATQLSNYVSSTLQRAFPNGRTPPRKSYITDATWRLRGDRLWYLRRLRSAKARLSQLTLRHAFDALQYGLSESFYFLTSPAFHLFVECYQYGQKLRNLTSSLHHALRADRNNFVIEVAEKASSHSAKYLHQHLRQLGVSGRAKQRGIRPLPALRDNDGSILCDPEAIADRWQEFFQHQEDGYRVSVDQLVREHFSSNSCGPVVPAWDFIPTLQELEYQFRRTQTNRAYFDDCFPGDLLHLLPDHFARIYYSLFVKTFLLQREPLIFKGGLLTPAYKGKGSPLDCASYRSLLVSSPIGKALHAILRRDAIYHFHKIAQPFQIGGLPGKSIAQATHSLLAYQWAAKQRKLSVGFIFIDVTNAFYRVLRQHLTQMPDERGLRGLFDSLGLHGDAFAEFQQYFQSRTAFAACDLPQHLTNMLTETLHGTWFTVAQSRSFSRTRRGTRPGDSLADLCYTYALAKILGAAFSKLDLPDKTVFYWDGQFAPSNDGNSLQPIDLLCPIWADDIALALAHPDPEQLVANIQHVARHVFEALATAGMAPNFKAGKTEAVLDLRGKGAHNKLRHLMQADMTLDFHSDILPSSLRVVDKYKHLGTWLTSGAKLTYDLRSKFAIAHATITKYRVAIFGNLALPIQRKIQLFRSLVLSAITFSIGAWHTLRPVELRQFITGIFRLYKRIARLHFGIDALHWGHDQLCFELNIEKPIVHLAIGKLRYIQQIIREGQPQLWGLLQQTTLWWDDFYEHFDWLTTRVPYLQCPHPRDDWPSFYHFLSTPGNAWKNLLKRAQSFELTYQRLHFEWKCWHHAALNRLQEVAPIPTAMPLFDDHQEFCLACSQTFSKPASWAVHAFRKHGRTTPARLYAAGTQCSACLKHYSTYTSLVNHLRYSQTCLRRLQAECDVVQLQPGWNSREELDSRRALHLPYLRAEGPMPAPIAAVDRPPCEQTRALLKEWTGAWQNTQNETPSLRLEALRQATCMTTLPRSDILTALDSWVGGALDEAWCTLDIFGVAQEFRLRCTFAWFRPGVLPRTDAKPIYAPEPVLEAYLQDLQVATPLRLLTLCYRPVCVAHLFSGHRRRHDIQSYAEIWGGALTGATVLSVDIVFDLQTADLTDPKKLDLFIRAIRAGLLHGFIAGPPCESWSVARETDDDGPRPLRDAIKLSGKDALTQRELKQISIGNALLGATLRLFLEALLSCTFALVEHPADPVHKPWAPSIWKLPLIQLFRKFPNCANVHIFQGYYGAPSAKPTQFLLANAIEGAPAFLAQFQSTFSLPSATSIGRNAKGEWRTMRLKTYPPALCKAIVGLLEASLAKHEWIQAPCDPDWFHTEITNLCRNFNYDAEIGPDFAG